MLAAAKEFNIGKETLVEFLGNKGFVVNASNPNTKLTEEMYDALQAEFAQDKLAKRKSEEIALPKGSLLDNLKKNKEELDLTSRDKKEEPEVKAPVAEKKKEEKPKAAEPVKEKQPEAAEPVAEPAPKKKAVKKEEEAPKEVAPPAEDKATDDTTEHIDVKAPKLGGPNVLGKINLEDMNMASRPKKGTAATTKKKTAKEEADEEKPAKETKKAKKADPKAKAAEEVEIQFPEAEAATPLTSATEAEDLKPEHIQMKAPRLEGPKIIGKIVLPVDNGNSGAKPDSKEKRNRKRIPVQKKPETFNPNQQGAGQGGDRRTDTRGPGTGQGFACGQGQNRGGGQGQNRTGGGQGQSRPPGTGGGAGQSRSGTQRSDHRRGQRGSLTPQQQEIDTKAIQDKIRETQAKLTGSTRGKSLKSKYRRNKREELADKRAAAENAEADKHRSRLQNSFL